MCLNCKKRTKIKIATEDIICYKVFKRVCDLNDFGIVKNGYFSPYFDEEWDLGYIKNSNLKLSFGKEQRYLNGFICDAVTFIYDEELRTFKCEGWKNKGEIKFEDNIRVDRYFDKESIWNDFFEDVAVMDGLHGFTKKWKANRRKTKLRKECTISQKLSFFFVVVECIIPKGALYVTCRKEIAATKMIPIKEI